jgi:hypothetical protein
MRIVFQADQDSSTNDTDEVGNSHSDAAGVRPTCTNEATGKEGEELNSAAGNLEILCSECVDAERGDNL